MDRHLPKLIATSVVRGSQKGESHGGVYTLDFERRSAEQRIDWNTGDIDFAGRGADRGLRGIAFDGEDIYIAASDELFRYNLDFEIQDSWKNRYLKHCHEICRIDRHLYLTSTGHDSLLVFDLDKKDYVWGFHLLQQQGEWEGFTFDPLGDYGPGQINEQHINMVHVEQTGIYFSGLHTRALLHLSHDDKVSPVCNLPQGTHNARPYGDGVIFNDTARDCVRLVTRAGQQQAFEIKHYDPGDLMYAGVDDSKVARQAFGRGLCVVGERLLAGGSSPSTITLYDMLSGQVVGSVNLSMDIRNAIHGLEVWPFD